MKEAAFAVSLALAAAIAFELLLPWVATWVFLGVVLLLLGILEM